MKEMLERKNKMLKEAGENLGEIWNIARMMDRITVSDKRDQTLIDLVKERLKGLSCNHDDFLLEAQIALPEAEQEAGDAEV